MNPEDTRVHPLVPYDACPLCSSKKHVPFRTDPCVKHPLWHEGLPRELRWRLCQACSHLFTDSYYSASGLERLFARTNDSQRPGADAGQTRTRWAPTVQRIAEHRSAGVWLDVGFGDGGLVFTAAEWGYRAIGLDLRKENVEILINLGFEAHAVSLTDVNDAEGFDVISMCDVLEHTVYPGAEIAHAGKLLKPGGILLVATPNMDTLLWRALDARQANPYWGELEHHHIFTRARLYDLLDQHGFDVVSYGISSRYLSGMEVLFRRRN